MKINGGKINKENIKNRKLGKIMTIIQKKPDGSIKK